MADTDPPRHPAGGPRDYRSSHGALALVALLLFSVAGILAIVAGADALGDEPGNPAPGRGDPDGDREVSGLVVLIFGVVLLACAWMAWAGRTYLPGVLGAVSGVILIVLFPDTAGVLALVGGIVLLAARAVPSKRWA